MLVPRPLTLLLKTRNLSSLTCFASIYPSPPVSAFNVPTHGTFSFLKFQRGASSLRNRGYTCLMPLHNTEYEPCQRANKRRRISASPTPPQVTLKMALEEQSIKQPVPKLELTPLENTIKTLLLDVKDYIYKKNEAEGEDKSEEEEMILRFTGGWVRDKLLGLHSHDIDVAISTMTGYQFGLALKEYLDVPENLEKYKQDGQDGELKDAIGSLHKIEKNPEKSKHLETVTTHIFGMDIDLVNLRKETYSDDSRNPQMEFGTAVEDALRRDATVNALFYNLDKAELEDLTGHGLEDMKAKLLRTPLEPYQTFKDDPLRVLRLIRFASRLGYHIHEDAQKAMQNDDIKDALKLKISKERVGTEVDKMLRGPDPRGALNYIDYLSLYSTIFANHRDDVNVDTKSWSLAYASLERITNPPDGGDALLLATSNHVRDTLLREPLDTYHAWYVAAFSPWATVPVRQPEKSQKQPIPPRVAEVARDSLRLENKIVSILKDATTNYRAVTDLKNSIISGSLTGTKAEIRLHVGWTVRSWKKDWRMCVVMALLQEIMAQDNFSKVVHEYDQFLSYLEAEDLLGVEALRPIVNGKEVTTALGASTGPWMTAALEMVIQWQLLHPGISEKEMALDEVRNRRGELGV